MPTPRCVLPLYGLSTDTSIYNVGENVIKQETPSFWIYDNVKGIKVSENLSVNPKPYRLSAHLPRCAPCRAFRKEVLKGETAEAQLKKASKNNINFNAERLFPVCTPATVCTPRESICFRTFTEKLTVTVFIHLTEQHSLFPS